MDDSNVLNGTKSGTTCEQQYMPEPFVYSPLQIHQKVSFQRLVHVVALYCVSPMDS